MIKSLVLIAALFGSAAAFAGGCKEGAKAFFQESDTFDSDRQVTVLRTCKNGSYYDLSNYVYNPKNTCTEGRRQIFTESDGNDHQRQVVRTCKNGSYYDLSNYVYNPKNKCKEGRIQSFSEPRSPGSDKQELRTYICKNGKYKQIKYN